MTLTYRVLRASEGDADMSAVTRLLRQDEGYLHPSGRAKCAANCKEFSLCPLAILQKQPFGLRWLFWAFQLRNII